jgi:dCTP deaminase
MIEPFVESQIRQGCISFGPSSYGYDIRIADEFQVFAGNSLCHSERSAPKAHEACPERSRRVEESNIDPSTRSSSLRSDSLAQDDSVIIDPKNFNPRSLTYLKGDVCVIPANSFVLARSLEYFRIPRNILALCFGKSSYARCGIIVNVTPSEPEWEGYLTMAISNTAPVPAKIYANEGIAQLIFLESDQPCAISYADRKGKYHAQREITLSKV